MCEIADLVLVEIQVHASRDALLNALVFFRRAHDLKISIEVIEPRPWSVVPQSLVECEVTFPANASDDHTLLRRLSAQQRCRLRETRESLAPRGILKKVKHEVNGSKEVPDRQAEWPLGMDPCILIPDDGGI